MSYWHQEKLELSCCTLVAGLTICNYKIICVLKLFNDEVIGTGGGWKRKQFTVKQHGDDAKQLAINHRKEMEELYYKIVLP